MASIPLSGPDQVSHYVVTSTPVNNPRKYCGETLTETVNSVSVLTCAYESLERSSDGEHIICIYSSLQVCYFNLPIHDLLNCIATTKWR